MHFWYSFSRAEKILLLLFLLSLPFVRAQVRGDGIGYYAYARSLLIDHNLQFRGDWNYPQSAPVLPQRAADGRVLGATTYTRTGHTPNHFSVGPAILWAPFLVITHLMVLGLDYFGWHIAADGFSRPYLVAMAGATALYGFASLLLSFRLAREYFDEQWSLLATIGIWCGSSLPAYMYVDTAWSHAHSAFMAALFIWYWNRTREKRQWIQWATLGAIAGLMIDVYYVSAVLLLFPALESIARYQESRNASGGEPITRIALGNVVFTAIAFVMVLPTLIAKKIIFGSYLDMGYTERWFWNSPALLKVCFSAQHGLFSMTPILILAVAGLLFLWKYDRALGFYSLAAFVIYLYTIGCYENWHGVSSFGNRFFITLTPIFVLGLAATFSEFARVWGHVRGAAMRAAAVSALLIMWNLGLVFQWKTGLLSDVSPVSWQEVVYNQFRIVPGELLSALRSRFAEERPADINRGSMNLASK